MGLLLVIFPLMPFPLSSICVPVLFRSERVQWFWNIIHLSCLDFCFLLFTSGWCFLTLYLAPWFFALHNLDLLLVKLYFILITWAMFICWDVRLYLDLLSQADISKCLSTWNLYSGEFLFHPHPPPNPFIIPGTLWDRKLLMLHESWQNCGSVSWPLSQASITYLIPSWKLSQATTASTFQFSPKNNKTA